MAMDLKIRINYRWRLFIPLVISLALIIAVLVVFQYKREMSYRAESLNTQLDLASDRLISAYELNVDIEPYLSFLSHYYGDSPVSVSVYDRQGNRIFCVGTPIYQFLKNGELTPELKMLMEQGGVGKTRRYSSYRDNIEYLYSVRRSYDGEIYVHTALPYTISVFEAISSQPSMWFIVIILTIIAMITAYYATRYFGKNVELLRDFANCEDNEERKKFAVEKFQSDELGDIGRRIVALYKEKDDAIEKGVREHEIAMHAVKEKSLLKRQLTNNINHELKTPIGVIKGYIDTIIEDGEMPAEKVREFVEKMHPHVVRLCNLLNDVSTITRLEEASGSIPVSPLNFHELIYAISNELLVTPIGGDLKFVYDLPVNCEVMGNNSLLNEAIMNLVRNAAVYSQGTEMGVKLIGQSEKYYIFQFYDNGIGVEASHLPQLFDRFYRVDTGRSRKAGGTGLGLPIVKNTIISMGGTISVKNRVGGGLEFVFTLLRVAN